MKTSTSLSVCLIVRNEERCLDRCLTSVRGFVDEIVVVDTGSTDQTVAIAASHGARVGHFKWCDDFAAARNAALDLATGDWILSLDADEWLAQGTGDYVRSEIHEAPSNLAYAPYVKVPDGSGYFGNARLFPRVGSRWEYRIHEQIRLAASEPRGVFDFNFLLFHDGYTPDVNARKEGRNHPLLLRQLAESPEGSREWKHAAIYLARALPRPYSPEDERRVEDALLLAVGFDDSNCQLLILHLFRALIESARFDEVERIHQLVLDRAGGAASGGPLIRLAAAISWLEAGDVESAKAQYQASLDAPDLVHARSALKPLFDQFGQLLGK